ncbi:MAG: FecR family protein [Betaproteobacteria bacterium]
MDEQRFRLGGRGVLMFAIAAGFPVIAHGAPAARVEFAIGNPTAHGSNGQSRPLTRGAEVGQGDTIDTGDGRVQLRFVDGAFVSLQPRSQFRIDEFRYNGRPDGNEKGFFSLLKGGLRTITGLVGRINKNAYQVNTAVATIGIRGTEYTINYGNSVSGSVGEGEIKVCNGGGCLNVMDGESYYVANADVRPQLADKKVDLPPQQPQSSPATLVQGENRDASGDPVSFILSGPQTVNLAYNKPGPSQRNDPAIPAVFDSSGALRSFDLGGGAITWSGPVYEQGNDGVIAWGRWAGGVTGGAASISLTTDSLHYVAGLPVGTSMPTGTAVGTYALIGGTTPTRTTDGAAGALDSASLTAYFGANASVEAAVKVSFTDPTTGVARTFGATGTGSISGELFSGFGGGCSFSCSFSGSGGNSLSFDGFFAGANARRAGMAYEIGSGSDTLRGAAALTRTNLP